MTFKTTCTITQLVKYGQSQYGNWYLYKIQEQLTGDKTKTWSVFAKTQLTVGGVYGLEGYISESPNKRYKDDGGKLAYQTTFNVETAIEAGASWPQQGNSGDEQIPF